MPELLGRREIGLPPTGATTNELIAKHIYERVCSRVFMHYVLLYIRLIIKNLIGREHSINSQ